jgi:hypothetical protein
LGNQGQYDRITSFDLFYALKLFSHICAVRIGSDTATGWLYFGNLFRNYDRERPFFDWFGRFATWTEAASRPLLGTVHPAVLRKIRIRGRNKIPDGRHWFGTGIQKPKSLMNTCERDVVCVQQFGSRVLPKQLPEEIEAQLRKLL